MKRLSVDDLDAPSFTKEQLKLRHRLLASISGDGTFNEEEHADRIAREIERRTGVVPEETED